MNVRVSIGCASVFDEVASINFDAVSVLDRVAKPRTSVRVGDRLRAVRVIKYEKDDDAEGVTTSS